MNNRNNLAHKMYTPAHDRIQVQGLGALVYFQLVFFLVEKMQN